jgi:5-methylcytosine-specific restriction endonuclease McrA
MPIDKELDRSVRIRAQGLCEYCHAPQAFYPERFHIDHIVARQHGGITSIENLALCCGECNRRKGPNLSGVDPQISLRCELFNPRSDSWNDHFAWRGSVLY